MDNTITQTEIKYIKVLIGQVSLTRAPNVLQSVLGSCIGLAIYDQESKIGGLAHILLPDSRGKKAGSLPGKFANMAVPCLYEALLKHGAIPNNLKAKMAGGAKMFKTGDSNTNQDIGTLNKLAVKRALVDLHVPLLSSECGGHVGRKVEFSLETFRLTVESLAESKREL